MQNGQEDENLVHLVGGMFFKGIDEFGISSAH